MARVVPPPFGFTRQQCEWYEKLVPDVPEEAVAQILREWRHPQHAEDLLQEAYVGTAKGVETYDPTKGALRQWVFFCALRAVQGFRRREGRYTGRVAARMWDGIIEHCKAEHHTVGVMGDSEADRAALTQFRNRAAAAAFVAVATLEVPDGGGNDEMVERLTAARCKTGLERALGELSGRSHELLRVHFADDQSVKDAAAARGEKGYRAELLAFHRAKDVVAARLAGMGFHERPSFPPEARGTLLRESPDPPATAPDRAGKT
jgi:DNA-directed RNA polymerase specialized sigma24 family protein